MSYFRRNITIADTAGITRRGYPVSIPLSALAESSADISLLHITVHDEKGCAISSQVDPVSPADQGPELVFQIDLKPLERRTFQVCYGIDNNARNTGYESGLSISQNDDRLMVENSVFIWDLFDAEQAEFRLKGTNGSGHSWEGRIWTWAGIGHNRITPGHDKHYSRRRMLNEVTKTLILTTGPVRAMVDIFYDALHFEENLNISRRYIFYANSPLVEKITTSHSGEPGIVLGAMLAKLGPHTLGEGTYCGTSDYHNLLYPRLFPKVPGKVPLDFEPEMNFEPLNTQFNLETIGPASYRTISAIDGITWGTVRNPRSGVGLAEFAAYEDVQAFFTGWEQDRNAESIHPLTDRAFGDFIFRCTDKRTFTHHSCFYQLDSNENLHTVLDEQARGLAHPVEVKIGPETLVEGDLAVTPSKIILDLIAGRESATVNMDTPDDSAPQFSVSEQLQAALEVEYSPSDGLTSIKVIKPDRLPESVLDEQLVIRTAGADHELPIMIINTKVQPQLRVAHSPAFPLPEHSVSVDAQAESVHELQQITCTHVAHGIEYSCNKEYQGRNKVATNFVIPAQEGGTRVDYTVEVIDIYGNRSSFTGIYEVLDAQFHLPLNCYAGEKLFPTISISWLDTKTVKAAITLLLDGEEVGKQTKFLDTGANALSIPFTVPDKSGKIQAFLSIDIKGNTAECRRTIHVARRTHSNHTDFWNQMVRPDKRTLHGNRLRYWGGQLDIYWRELEPETLGFTHAWYYDGRSWGSFPERDWEFWRREKIAYGTIHFKHDNKSYETPVPEGVNWRPGLLETSYLVEQLAVSEAKYIHNDVLVNRIKLRNNAGNRISFSLIFRGKGHGLSAAAWDVENRIVAISEHAHAYTGLEKQFAASIPFSGFFCHPDEEFVVNRVKSGSLGNADSQLGEPVHYAFSFDVELETGEEQEFDLAFTFSDNRKCGCQSLRKVLQTATSCLDAVQWEWNDWLNYQVPQIECQDEQLKNLFYYLWFVYRINLIDIGKGWLKHPYVAPTASTYFITPFGWDSAFHVMIGKWIADTEYYTYGNLKNWAKVQTQCGYLPEFFGLDWRSTWCMELNVLHAWCLYDIYMKEGNQDLVLESYPVCKKFEQWLSCEIDYSPYWRKYFLNVPDAEERQANFRAGSLYHTARVEYYRRMAKLAAIAGDLEYMANLQEKTILAEQKMRAESAICSGATLQSLRHANHIGMEMFWAPELANHERIAELVSSIRNPDEFATELPVAAYRLDAQRPGDGWDHGTSVTVDYFLIHSLYEAGYADDAWFMLEALLKASFFKTVAGPRPTAPEYWNEYAEPWGCIEYTWNGLLNNLLIERVAGIRPNKPGGLLVVEPNLPKGIDFLEIAYPVDGAWTCVAHHRDEHSFLTKVKGATEKVEYHLKLSDHFEVQKVLVDDAAYEFEIIDGQITVVVSNQSDFSIRILF